MCSFYYCSPCLCSTCFNKPCPCLFSCFLYHRCRCVLTEAPSVTVAIRNSSLASLGGGFKILNVVRYFARKVLFKKIQHLELLVRSFILFQPKKSKVPTAPSAQFRGKGEANWSIRSVSRCKTSGWYAMKCSDSLWYVQWYLAMLRRCVLEMPVSMSRYNTRC